MAKTKAKKEKRKMQYSSAKERAEKHESSFSRTSVKVPDEIGFFQMKKEGNYRLDFIPYETGEGNPYAEPGILHYERTYFTHRGIGPNGDTYVCPAKTWGKKCPICEHRAKLGRDPEADDDLVKSLIPKERQLFLVIDRTTEEELAKGLQLWDVSFHLFGKLLDTYVKNEDEDDNYSNFYHLDGGMTLKLTAVEKSFGGNDFREVKTIEFKPRKKALPESLLDEVPCLDDLLIEVEYDKLKAIFLQTEEGDEEDSDVEDSDVEDSSVEEEDSEVEEKPKKGKKAPPKKVKSKKDEDEDDSDVEDSEVEDSDVDSDTEDSDVEDSSVEEDSDADALTASDFDIEVGTKVKHEDHGLCEVSHISKDGTSLKLKDKKGKVHSAIGVADVEVITEKKGKAPPKGKVKKDEEDSEVEDEDDIPFDSEVEEEDEDSEEEEKPKKKGKKK